MSTSLDDLQSCLNHEIDLVKRFLHVLNDEALALAQPENNAVLAASTRQKNQFAQQLSDAAGIREALLAKLGLSAGKAGLDEAARQDPALQAVCDELFSLAEKARNLNVENGTVIEMYLAHNQRAIQTLRSLAGSGSLYDAKGHATI